MENMLISGNTDSGRLRKENQDAWISRQLRSADKALLVVIDGVGGYTGGEKAAAIAKDCIEQYMQTPSGDMLTMLREAVIFANNQVVAERKKDPQASEMCCVLTAVVADAATQCIYFAHVGDTRLYRFRDSILQKLTRDHSFVGIREDAGEMSETEAMQHPHRNQILREVGTALHRLDDEDFMDYGSGTLLPGDLLLLCSDGLTDMITSQQITTVLQTNVSLTEKVNNLIALANENGGHDNITVVLLQQPYALAVVKDQVTAPVAVVDPEPVLKKSENKKATHKGNAYLLLAFLLLVLVTGAGWYFAVPGHTATPVTGPEILPDTNTNKVASREEHTAVVGPVTTQIPDTLMLSATKNYTDIKKYTDSTGKPLVLVPAKNNNGRFAAITINGKSVMPGDTLLVSNLHLAGFETGISVQVPVSIKTDNLIFENTNTPFRYLLKPNGKQASLLFNNPVKQ